MAAAHSVELTTKVASGKSETALAWSMWRCVISTTLTSDSWIRRERSWAETAWSCVISRPLKEKRESRPRFSLGLTATEE